MHFAPVISGILGSRLRAVRFLMKKADQGVNLLDTGCDSAVALGGFDAGDSRGIVHDKETDLAV